MSMSPRPHHRLSRRGLLFGASMAALATACATANADAPRGVPSPTPAAKGIAPVGPVSADVRHLAAAGNVFAMDLYDQLAAAPGNFAYSPASISIALAMTWAGARGQTAEQMANVLHFDLPQDTLHAANSQQLARYNDELAQAVTLRVVNRLFGEQTTKFEAPFLDRLAHTYAAPLERVDFIDAAEPARVHINEWVADQTDDRIDNLIPPGSLDHMTRLVLTNAVYFKGTWKTQFEAEATTNEPFRLSSGQTAEVPTMRLVAELPLTDTDEVQVLQLPYEGDALAMDVILPKTPSGLAALERDLTAAKLEQWLADAVTTEVEVALPRFKIDPPDPISLASTLEQMGMPIPFSPRDADFSGMSKSAKLFIDDVFHKAFVEVNEEGTEAAAATAVVMAEESAMVSMPVRFTADHPFVFTIRDRTSGALLFVGRVADPRG